MDAASPSPNIPENLPLPQIDLNSISQEAQEILASMLQLLSFQAKLSSTFEKETIRIHMQCEDAGRLIGRRGSTVNEIQFLLNRILQRRHKPVPRIFLDVDGPQEVQQAQEKINSELLNQAKSKADQVRRWGESVELGSFKAEDCKILQDFFARDKELEVVTTSSRPSESGMQTLRIQLRKP